MLPRCWVIGRMTLGSSDMVQDWVHFFQQLSVCNNSAIVYASDDRKSRYTSCSTDSGVSIEQPGHSGMNSQEENVEEDLRRELVMMRQIPYRDYTCHRCGIKGHMIRYCPTKDMSSAPTTYQGNRRSIGFFHCIDCGRHWKCDEVFANQAQQCGTCHRLLFPHKMQPFKGV